MNGVKVQSIDSLKLLRAAIVRFEETAQMVLSEADGDLARMTNWIETEAVSHWQTEIRRRQQALAKAKDELRAKKLFHADGFKPSVVDEEKAVRLATLRLEEAERKLVAVHRYGKVLAKEVMQYHGQVHGFRNTVSIDLPVAVGRLDALVRHLEKYMGLKPVETGEEVRVLGSGISEAGAEEALPSMARPEGEDRGTEGQGDGGTAAGGDKETRGQGDKESGGGGEGERSAAEAPAIRNPKSESRDPESPHGSL